MLVARADSVFQSEPTLVPIGGKYKMKLYLPVDPMHILARSNFACMNEASFSLDTVSSSNAYYFFDARCKVEQFVPLKDRTYEMSSNNCHWSQFPNVSCIDALKKYVGMRRTQITWTRLAWSEELASQWRLGEMTSDTADLAVIDNLESIYFQYKYFASDSCALHEAGVGDKHGCIGKPGWRQLLKFTSSAVNQGKTDMYLGAVEGIDEQKANMYVWSDCHKHFHFQHYGSFKFGDEPGRKVGFCLQTTWRYFNNEWTSLNTPYETCSYQGISKH
jgi:hypothetical protein